MYEKRNDKPRQMRDNLVVPLTNPSREGYKLWMVRVGKPWNDMPLRSTVAMYKK